MKESIIYIAFLFLLFLMPEYDPCYKKLATVFSPICFGGSALISGNVDESNATNVSYEWTCTDGQSSTNEDFTFMDMTGNNVTCTLIVTHGDGSENCIIEVDQVIEVNPEVTVAVTGYNGPYCESETFTLDVSCDFIFSSSHGTVDQTNSTITFEPGDLPEGITDVEVVCTAPGPCSSEPFIISVEICGKPTVSGGDCIEFQSMIG